MKSKSTSMIVCETEGRWAAALRKELPPGVPLVETRSMSELWQQLDACPTATVMVELTAVKAEQGVAALLRMAREFPQIMPIVVADRSLSAWEDAVREAGAVHFIASPRRLSEVGQIVLRRMKSLPVVNPDGGDEAQSIEDRILASLPWAV